MKVKKALIWIIPIIAVTLSTGMLYYAINKANDIKYGEKITAKYYDSNDNVIKKVKTRGGFVEPPPSVDVGESKIFMSWDKDILNIYEDTEIRPSVTDISDTANTFYIDTSYVPNEEKFNVEVKLGGIVDCCGGSFNVKYNSERLKFESAKSRQDYVSVKTEDGIEIVFDNDKNINSPIVLAELSFTPITEGYSYSELQLELIEVLKFKNGGEKAKTDCSLYNGKIYSY